MFAQSDYSGKFTVLGMKNEVQAGIDVADGDSVTPGATGRPGPV